MPEYEYRWRQPERVLTHSERPRWNGAPLAGKTILLYAEQGFGDTLQFIRYAALVKECVGTVLFESQPELMRLLEGAPGVDQIIERGKPIPSFDVQAPLLSLPGIFKTKLATIPARVPYVSADPVRVAVWRKKLASLRGCKIGIAWQGSPTYRDDLFRSVPLAEFGRLGRLKGVNLVSLQVGPGAEQLESFDPAVRIVNLSEQLRQSGFPDTAAVLMNLDLVVTVDSVLAHLAGALGLPVWTLVPAAPDWRWLLGRADTPWYPSMRLFRQQQLGDWQRVFEQIADELTHVFNLT